jgi:hypothetical protein
MISSAGEDLPKAATLLKALKSMFENLTTKKGNNHLEILLITAGYRLSRQAQLEEVRIMGDSLQFAGCHLELCHPTGVPIWLLLSP